MNNFIVIDHSIKRIGGHNYEYALHILAAAEQQGYQPILAVNRRFFERRRLPASWQVHAMFTHTTYETAHLAAKQKRLARQTSFEPMSKASSLGKPLPKPHWYSRLPTWLRRRLVQHYARQHQLVIDRYAADLDELFAKVRIKPGDHVFIPTLSQDDLEGLVAFVRTNYAIANRPTWHLQFHFSIHEGRNPENHQGERRLDALRHLFRDFSKALPPNRACFYTTTDILAQQYSDLGAGPFSALPYPVNPALLDKSSSTSVPAFPLRVTCAGGVRAEKGTSDLYRIVAPLWQDYFDNGRMQLVVQAKRVGKLPRALRRHARPSRAPAFVQQGPPKVEFVRWPVSTERYLDLIHNSHIGLLLYDADQYYARCSGVMVEMLKAGVPVIVPAGCWMAEQIAEPIFAHRDLICQTTPVAALLTPAEADWEAGPEQRYQMWRRNSHLLVGSQTTPVRTRLVLPSAASHLCIRFRWAATNPRGSYVAVSASFKPDGEQIVLSREVVGLRQQNGQASALFPLPAAARKLQLTWQNAVGTQLLELENVEFLFLSATPGACPLGAVGLIAAGVDQAAALLRDIADHYAHYRRTAEAFAPAWGEWHSPAKVLELLTSTSGAESRFAA